MEYQEFLQSKRHSNQGSGFEPDFLPSFLFDFQRHLVEWAVRIGRGALFADTGLGKGPMALVWAHNVVRHTNKPVLFLTPLAVSRQIVREAEKFQIPAWRYVKDKKAQAKIVVANYEKLHYFDPQDFVGVVCDESSVLKNMDGRTREEVTQFLKKIPYRLLCTATAAPNDYVELGTSSEALGYLGNMDMLVQFFKHDDKTIHGRDRYKGFEGNRWRFKAHAQTDFWRWVCSWARACRKPSDLGFDDSRFVLPPLNTEQHTVPYGKKFYGFFPPQAKGLDEQRDEVKRTVKTRCEKAASLVRHREPAVCWCHRNDEGDLLEELIPDAEQVSGTDSDERKEELFEAFVNGQLRVLVTKPKIGGWGLNWQHCAHQTFFVSHSFEAFYQCVRRSYRFGQKRPVKVDVITSEGLSSVLANLKRKGKQAEAMFSALVQHMNQPLYNIRSQYGDTTPEKPSWLA